MANKNTQPIYNGASPDGSFPLSPSPYYSRTEDKNVIFDEGEFATTTQNNYQFVAFRPGFSLQASELNEMQENLQLQMTLSIAMMHNWITTNSSFLWNGWNNDAPSSEGGATHTPDYTDFPPASGVGVGGGQPGQEWSYAVGTSEGYSVSGPGWRGATPLYPFKSPYVRSDADGDGSLVSITPDGDKYKVVFNPGWWLVEVRDEWDGTSVQPTGVSGLKHWVHLSTPVEILGLDISKKYTVVGLDVSSNYIKCCSDEASCDSELADNASGYPNPQSCGADRYGLSINGAAYAESNANGTWDPVSYTHLTLPTIYSV